MLESWSLRKALPAIHSINTLPTLDESHGSLVASRPRILQYLREIHGGGLDLSLRPADYSPAPEFSTRVLRIEEDRILLHQPTPGDWREYLQEGARVTVSSQLPSGAIRFAAQLFPMDERGLSYCLLSLPEQLSRKQLRAFFRVSLLKYDALFEAELDSGASWSGKVCDLSLGGLLCQAGEQMPAVAKGEVLSRCRLRIPNMLDIRFDAVVCHRVGTDASGKARTGLKFLTLSADAIAGIRRTIARVERENIRRHTLS